MHKQLEHQQLSFQKQKMPVSLLLDNVADPLNVGSIFRIADAVGIDQIYLCGSTPYPPHRRISKTSRQTERWINYHYTADALLLARELQQQKYHLIAIEITNRSTALHNFRFVADAKYCLILGHEENGVSEQLLQITQQALHIAMRGNNSSVNVAQAATMACYEAARQFDMD